MVTSLRPVSTSEYTGGDTGAENLALQTEVKGLRELVDLYRVPLKWQHLSGAPSFWLVSCSKTIIPEAREHLFAASGH